MIEVLTANTPNGKKITIMLEEIQFDYKITKININKDEQFSKEFKKISPFSKIPVIIDHGNNESIFESGAILMCCAVVSPIVVTLPKKDAVELPVTTKNPLSFISV